MHSLSGSCFYPRPCIMLDSQTLIGKRVQGIQNSLLQWSTSYDVKYTVYFVLYFVLWQQSIQFVFHTTEALLLMAVTLHESHATAADAASSMIHGLVTWHSAGRQSCLNSFPFIRWRAAMLLLHLPWSVPDAPNWRIFWWTPYAYGYDSKHC